MVARWESGAVFLGVLPMKIEKINPDMAEVWLRMAFFAANPGIEAEDDWGIELPTVSEATPDVEALLLRTVSF
jgi:hypothetical protein